MLSGTICDSCDSQRKKAKRWEGSCGCVQQLGKGSRTGRVRRRLIKYSVFDLQVTSLCRVALRHPLEICVSGILPEKLKTRGYRLLFRSGLDFDLSFLMRLWVRFHLYVFKTHPDTLECSPCKWWCGEPAKIRLSGFLLQPQGKSPPQPEP